MECNKDEAIRAQTIAEKKFKDKDIAGAKKFALKAQNLYPPLEGISQMLSTLDVYIAAENRVSGDMDWYGILGVTPTADDDTIRKQYRKLALMLHPDKNKSVGAEGAFKFISEAWTLLSDKAKRLAYNQKRSTMGFQRRGQTQPQRPYTASTSNGVGNSTNSVPLRPTTQRNTASTSNGVGNSTNSVPLKPTTQRNTVPPPSFRRSDTFWTICSQCKMQYEYMRVYLNNPLRCTGCHNVFMAIEIAPPVESSYSSSQQSNQNIGNQAPIIKPGRNTAAAENIRQGVYTGPNSSKHPNTHSGAYPNNMAATDKAEPFVAAKASKVFQQGNCGLKREHEESQGFKVEPSSKRRVLNGDDRLYGDKLPFQMPMGNSKNSKGNISGPHDSKNSKGNISGPHGFVGVNSRPKSTRESTPLENPKKLMEKALKEIRKKLNEWESEAFNMVAEKNKKVERIEEEKMKSANRCHAQSNGIGEASTIKRDDNTKKNLGGTSADGEKSEDPVAMSMDVPDPDFHDFDQDRAETSFKDNQIWAAYDDDDGMPRYYAFVQKVISYNPFKLRISWLASRTNNEFGSLEWVSAGFAKSCGELRIGKYEVNKTLNSFSHKVKWTKGARGIIQILPQKGDIWALYRNWSSDWNENTPDEVIHKYDMVEVLDDYNEERGIPVTPLIKVAGFRTVFRPHQSKIMTIPKEEMFRFSHQVPNYVLTGKEAQNAPKGCQELDPAATPLELLQVINEVEVPAVESHGHANKEILLNAPEISVI